MAKKVLNLRSSEQGKKPTQDQIDYGQIAVNYNENNERIFIKNSKNNIIDFIPTHEVDKHIQDNVKLSSGYTESSLSNEELEPKPNDSLDTAVGKLHKSIKDNEEVISSAIDKIRNSTGFDENLGFSSTNELISGTTSLKDAIEKVADKANSGVDTSTLATKEELQSGLEAKQDKGNYITVETADGKYATIDNLNTKLNTDTYNSDKATFALKSEIPSVSLSSGYTESSLSNEELEPKANETFEVAIGKLHKAIKDNEIVDSTAFDKIKNSCGFDVNGNYKPTNELIADATSLTEAIDIIAKKLSTLI